jgi:predicted nucleic acid-binding protein
MRNLEGKSRAGGRLALLLRMIVLEVVPEAGSPDVAFWRDMGFDTDSPVVAAAIAAEVEYLCSGDSRLLRELPTYKLALEIVSPRRLLTLLEVTRSEP